MQVMYAPIFVFLLDDIQPRRITHQILLDELRKLSSQVADLVPEMCEGIIRGVLLDVVGIAMVMSLRWDVIAVMLVGEMGLWGGRLVLKSYEVLGGREIGIHVWGIIIFFHGGIILT